jgi:hypothetical protein
MDCISVLFITVWTVSQYSSSLLSSLCSPTRGHSCTSARSSGPGGASAGGIVGTRFHWRDHDYDLCEAEWLKLPAAERAYYDAIAPPPGSAANGARQTKAGEGQIKGPIMHIKLGVKRRKRTSQPRCGPGARARNRPNIGYAYGSRECPRRSAERRGERLTRTPLQPVLAAPPQVPPPRARPLMLRGLSPPEPARLAWRLHAARGPLRAARASPRAPRPSRGAA